MSARSRLVLIVEDDADVREVVVDTLRQHDHVVHEASSGAQARALISDCRPDIVLLDLGLPDEAGLDLLSHLVESAKVPVIVLSGRAGEIDRVVGLELGADDYIAKPFSGRELAARVNAVLRRTDRQEPSTVLRFGPLEIDERSRDVRLNGRLVSLTAREFDVLAYLARAPRQVFSRTQLLQHIWASSPRWQDDKTVAEHVHRIRRKLDEEDRERWIETVRGVGYRFTGAPDSSPAAP